MSEKKLSVFYHYHLQLKFQKYINDTIFKKSLASVFGAETQPTADELADFTTLFKYNGGKRIAHKLIRYMTEREKYRARWNRKTRVPRPQSAKHRSDRLGAETA